MERFFCTERHRFLTGAALIKHGLRETLRLETLTKLDLAVTFVHSLGRAGFEPAALWGVVLSLLQGILRKTLRWFGAYHGLTALMLPML